MQERTSQHQHTNEHITAGGDGPEFSTQQSITNAAADKAISEC